MSQSGAPYRARRRGVQAALDGHDLDALLVTHLPNVFYLTGLRASAGALLVGRDAARLIVDSRYVTAATALVERGGDDDFQIVEVHRSYDEQIGDTLADLAPSRVGVEADHLTVRSWRWLTRRLEGHAITLTPVDQVVERGRLVKEAGEISYLREAAARLSAVVAPILDLVRSGKTERRIAAEIEHAVRSSGFEDRAFPTIVASGPNSALPHARPSDRRLETLDLVVLDFGGVHAGYFVDLSRTVAVGRAGAETRRLHAAVAEAQREAIAAVRPGIPASDVDTVARSVLAQHGLAEAFAHATGHGLGVELHEAPRVGRVGEPGTETLLRPGMVFTIEPGVYVPGTGGVRIEDDVLVTIDGCEVLTDASTELVV